MEKSKNTNQNHNFLKEGFKDVSKHHKEYLGTDIPENYFAKSKLSILDKVKENTVSESKPKQKKQKIFWLQPQFKYIAAASLVFILSLTIWLQNINNTKLDDTNLEFLASSDDVLLESLLIEDAKLDAFTDNTLFNEVIVKAEISEQKMDDLILNSLIIEDSLLDNYMNNELMETIIL